MSLKDWLKSIALLLTLGVWNIAAADDGGCAGGMCGAPSCGGAPCQKFHCPGPYTHCTPQVPCLKFKSACGKPLCDTCDMPGYGYYPTCWRAWDQPLNYVCAVPTPTQLVQPPPVAPFPPEAALSLPQPPGTETPKR
jgi:hypothetical protein